MNILHAISSGGWGGAENFTAYLAKTRIAALNNKKINDFFLRTLNCPPVNFLLRLLKSAKKPRPSKIDKVLFIKLEGMGDSVYLLEIIHRLYLRYPSLKIDVLSTPQNPLFPLFNNSSDKFGLKILNPLNPISYFKTVKSINKENYDIIFDLTGMPVNIPLMLLFAKSYKAGFATMDLRKNVYDYSAAIDENIHIFDNYINLVKSFFPVSEEKKFTFFSDKFEKLSKEPTTATENLAESTTENHNFINLVLSSNGGGNMSRRLPPDNSALLISLLTKNYPQYKINLLGGPMDYDYLEQLCAGLTMDIVSVKKTKNIPEAIELLKNSLFNICIDSGLMHISSLVNPNTYCLFGYSSPVNSLPFNNIGYYAASVDCAPCSFYRISECKTLECMDKIDVKAVMGEIISTHNL